MSEQRLSFVLPIALAETGRPGDELGRFHLLLESFLELFDTSSIGNFLIVTRPDDLHTVGRSLAAFPAAASLPFEITDENALCPEFKNDPDTTHPWPQPNRGWHRQQLIKLACCSLMATEFYMTLDCDVIFRRRFSANDLILDGRALLNVQREAEYRRLWTEPTVAEEVACRLSRREDAARVLSLPARPTSFYYGETPAILNVNIVKRIIKHIEEKGDADWRQVLIKSLTW